MPSKNNTCIDCGIVISSGASRCKPCATHKRFADARANLTPPNPSGKCFCGCGGFTPIAEATRLRKGYVRGEHTKWIVGHQSRKEQRGDSGGALYVEEDRGYVTPCHIWQGMKSSGYAIRRDGRRRNIRIHREKFEERHGPLPEGMVPDHLCRQRACVNVEHMEAVTRGENVLRGMHPKMIAFRNETCVQGHAKTPENGYRRANGKWVCRPCRNAYKRRRAESPHRGHLPSVEKNLPST